MEPDIKEKHELALAISERISQIVAEKDLQNPHELLGLTFDEYVMLTNAMHNIKVSEILKYEAILGDKIIDTIPFETTFRQPQFVNNNIMCRVFDCMVEKEWQLSDFARELGTSLYETGEYIYNAEKDFNVCELASLQNLFQKPIINVFIIKQFFQCILFNFFFFGKIIYHFNSFLVKSN